MLNVQSLEILFYPLGPGAYLREAGKECMYWDLKII